MLFVNDEEDDGKAEGQGSLSREIPFQRGRVKRVEKVSTFAPLPVRLFTSFLIVPLLSLLFQHYLFSYLLIA
jgi:hypothetical protein